MGLLSTDGRMLCDGRMLRDGRMQFAPTGFDPSGATRWFDIIEKKGRLEQRVNFFTYTYLMTESVKEKHIKMGLVATKKGNL